MFNPISLMTGNIASKLLVGGAVAVGLMLLLNANDEEKKQPDASLMGINGATKSKIKKSGTIKL
jgi:hypothetical protein